jgi:hypothetical protein
MFGKNPQLSPLQLRKQLLLAESELSRAQLEQDCLAIRVEVRMYTRHLRTVGGAAAITTALVALFAAWRRPATAAPAAKKTSWLQTLLAGAGLLSTFWKAGPPRESK